MQLDAAPQPQRTHAMDTGRHGHATAASRRHCVDARLQVSKDFGRATRLDARAKRGRRKSNRSNLNHVHFHGSYLNRSIVPRGRMYSAPGP